MEGEPKTKPYILGLTIGTFWLIAASAGFAMTLLGRVGTGNARTALIAIAVAALAFLAISASQIKTATKLPPVPRTTRRRAVGRKFGGVVIIEVVAILVANTVCFSAGLMSWLVPVDLIIVGIHFIPLARLFGVPRYTAMGLAFCAVSVLTLLFVSADAQLGAVATRFLISSLGCAASAWLTAAANVFEIRHLLSEVP